MYLIWLQPTLSSDFSTQVHRAVMDAPDNVIPCLLYLVHNEELHGNNDQTEHNVDDMDWLHCY